MDQFLKLKLRPLMNHDPLNLSIFFFVQNLKITKEKKNKKKMSEGNSFPLFDFTIVSVKEEDKIIIKIE